MSYNKCQVFQLIFSACDHSTLNILRLTLTNLGIQLIYGKIYNSINVFMEKSQNISSIITRERSVMVKGRGYACALRCPYYVWLLIVFYTLVKKRS